MMGGNGQQQQQHQTYPQMPAPQQTGFQQQQQFQQHGMYPQQHMYNQQAPPLQQQQPNKQQGGMQMTGADHNNNNNSKGHATNASDRLSKYDHEAPLLQELGIDLGFVVTKTAAVMLPHKALPEKMRTDNDLAGPLFFCLTLGVCLLMSGKLHFGYIFGFGITGSVLIYLILNLMHREPVGFDMTCSILGYGLVPIVLVSALNVFLAFQGSLAFGITCFSVGWCTFSATRYIEFAFDMRSQRYLVGYPVVLMYACFALIGGVI
jgi:hypothetical protein